MRQTINSQQEFDNGVKGSSGGMMLLFHSSNSDPDDLDKYATKAEQLCGPTFSIFSIDIDHVVLSPSDVVKYQDGLFVICCTLLFSDNVIYKEVNPDPADLTNSIQC